MNKIAIVFYILMLTIGKYEDVKPVYKVYMPVAITAGIRPVCRLSLWVFIPRDQCDYVN